MTDKATSDLWWKNAVIYCADVATWVDSDGDGVGDRVRREDIQGLRRGEAEPMALTDRERVRSRVLAEGAPGAVQDRAGAAPETSVAREEVALTCTREEAQILRVPAAGDGQARALCQLAHLRLAQLAEGEAQARE